MILGIRLNSVSALMANAQLEQLVADLEAEHGKTGDPRRWYARTPR